MESDSYVVVVQASPEEILGVIAPDNLILESLRTWPAVRNVVVLMPDLEGAPEAAAKLKSWGFRTYVGDPYNVCFRILGAHAQFPEQPFAVRLLAIWKHVDLDYVDRLVQQMRRHPCDFVAAPKDFDITMAADVASLKALQRIGAMPGTSQEIMRAKFNPWGYMEMHPDEFLVTYLEPAPRYSPERCREILGQQRCHPENEFFGRDYAGSRYHFVAEQLPPGLRILDLACGSGFGTKLLSQNAAFVLGVDYLEVYIEAARKRYPENDRLQFMVGDAQKFLYQNREGQFDLVISLHTVEHVPDDRAMLASLYRNLRAGGQLILEGPLLAQRPLGVPINPHHLKEYTPDQLMHLVEAAGFKITRVIGSCRSFYGNVAQARDAVQIHAVKPVA